MAIWKGMLTGMVLIAGTPALGAEQLAGLPPGDGFPAAPIREETSAPVPTVTEVRVGRHAARTRVTLDLTGPAAATVRQTTSGRSVVLSFPAIHWQAADHEYRTGGLVSRFRFGAVGQGGDLALIVAEAVEVAGIRHLPPAGKGGGYRIEIDLVPTRVVAEATSPAEPASFGTTTVRLSP